MKELNLPKPVLSRVHNPICQLANHDFLIIIDCFKQNFKADTRIELVLTEFESGAYSDLPISHYNNSVISLSVFNQSYK